MYSCDAMNWIYSCWFSF